MAITALALMLRTMATSVVNTSDLMSLPKILMPLTSWITSGTVIMCFLSVPVKTGASFFMA